MELHRERSAPAACAAGLFHQGKPLFPLGMEGSRAEELGHFPESRNFSSVIISFHIDLVRFSFLFDYFICCLFDPWALILYVYLNPWPFDSLTCLLSTKICDLEQSPPVRCWSSGRQQRRSCSTIVPKSFTVTLWGSHNHSHDVPATRPGKRCDLTTSVA